MIFRPIIVLLFAGTVLTGQSQAGYTVSIDDDARQSARASRRARPQVRGQYQQVFTHTIDVDGVSTLIMKRVRGDVIIKGSSANRIKIVEKIRGYSRFIDRNSDERYVEATKGWLGKSESKKNEYVFTMGRQESSNYSYRYEVTIPKTSNLFVSTNIGDIDLSDVQGDLEIEDGAGDISITNVGGKIRATTRAGDVDAYNVEGDIQLYSGGGDIGGRHISGQVDIQTAGGSIEIRSGKGAFDIKTGGGDVDLTEIEGTSIVVTTAGGEIDIVKITSDVSLRTAGGNITAENVRGLLEAASSGGDMDIFDLNGDAILFSAAGDINLKNVSGAIRAKTNHGDIDIENLTLTQPGRDVSSFTTDNGNISIEITAKFDVDVVARISGYTPSYARRQFEGNLDLEYHKESGSIVGVHKVNDAKHRIVIEARNGTITIVKNED